MKRLILSAALAATLLPAAAAVAAPPAPDAAMRKGVRDYARSVHATASHVQVHCDAAPDVDDRAACTGSFRLVRGGRSADYALQHGARVLRLSPNALEHRVEARTARAATGLPRTTGAFAGVLQGA